MDSISGKPNQTDRFIHRFEEAGLGVAPFILQGVCLSVDWHSCDYCCTAIKEQCFIRDANGKVFTVGNECVRHTGDRGLIDTVKRALNEARTEARHKKEAETISKGKELLAGNSMLQNILKLKSHPNEELAGKGATLLDYVEYLFSYSGNAGKCRAVGILWDTLANFPNEDERAELQKERDEIQARIDAENEAKEAVRVKEMEEALDNSDIIEVLKEQTQTPFIVSMIDRLTRMPLEKMADKPFCIVADIYAKSKGRRGSSLYEKAYQELEDRRG